MAVPHCTRSPKRLQPDDWRRLILQQQTSELTVTDFCNKHNLAQPSFYLWRKKLGLSPEHPGFQSVQVVPNPPGIGCSPVVLELAGGHRLLLTYDFDEHTLRRLLKVIGEPDP